MLSFTFKMINYSTSYPLLNRLDKNRTELKFLLMNGWVDEWMNEFKDLDNHGRIAGWRSRRMLPINRKLKVSQCFDFFLA